MCTVTLVLILFSVRQNQAVILILTAVVVLRPVRFVQCHPQGSPVTLLVAFIDTGAFLYKDKVGPLRGLCVHVVCIYFVYDCIDVLSTYLFKVHYYDLILCLRISSSLGLLKLRLVLCVDISYYTNLPTC